MINRRRKRRIGGHFGGPLRNLPGKIARTVTSPVTNTARGVQNTVKTARMVFYGALALVAYKIYTN